MKKRLSIKVLSLVLAFFLSVTSAYGCGKNDIKENVSNGENTESVETDDSIAGDTENDEADENGDSSADDDTDSSDDEMASDGSNNENTDNDDASDGNVDGGNTDSSNDDGESGSGSSDVDNSGSESGGDNHNSGGGNSGNEGSNSNSGTLSAGEQMAKDIVASIITTGMSDFEKAITIHDWITYNIDYDLTYSNYYLEETLRDRTGVCQGYAEAFNSMAKWAGLESVFVGGSADNGSGEGYVGHAWNRVKIDGVWYNVDTTWDDPAWDGKNPSDHTYNGYSYFLISDATLNVDHKVEFVIGEAGNCPKDYDRGAIYRHKLTKEERDDVVYVDDKSDILEEIYRQYESGKNDIVVWCYDDWTTDEITDVFNAVFDEKYGLCVGLVKNDVQMSETGRLVKYHVTMEISYSEWSAIPVATTNEELNRICEEQVAKGIRQVKVRFEPTDPNETAEFTDWLSKYGILSVSVEYEIYNGAKYVLYSYIF